MNMEHLIRLNCGSGYLPLPGYTNIDIYTGEPNYCVDVIHDIRKLKEIYKDNSVDEIFAKDTVEHISWREVPKLLQDWIDILKVGGVLKIRVPDTDRIMDEYFVHREDPDKRTRFYRTVQLLFGDQTFTENAHLAGFRREFLVEDLRGMGLWVPPNGDKYEPWYDGGRDLRISAVKGTDKPLVTLDHPDYQYKLYTNAQMREMIEKQ